MAFVSRSILPFFILLAIFCLAGCQGGGTFKGQANVISPEPLFTFGLVADAQYADAEMKMNRYYRASLGKLADCVADLNTARPEFVVDLGDLVDRDFASFGPAMEAYKPLRAPLYHVAGNHDMAAGGSDRERVAEVMSFKGNAEDRRRKCYYDFARPGWRFIVLDGNDLSLYATAEGTPERAAAEAMLADLGRGGAVNAQEWNGGLGEAQLTWLRATLARAEAAGERVIVFCHFPIWPENVHNLWNADAALAAIDEAPNVVAWISGHNHAGNYARRGDGMGDGGGRDGCGLAPVYVQHHLTLHGMVETADQSAYALVEVWPDRLHIDGRGTMESIRDLPLAPAPAK